MPIVTTARITNLTPYEIVFVDKKGNTISEPFESQGIALCRTRFIDSPIMEDIADATGGVPVKFDACMSFFCVDANGSLICERLPETSPGHFLLVTEEIARRANQHKIYRGIIFPKEYQLEEDSKGKRMLVNQLGTFWSHRRD